MSVLWHVSSYTCLWFKKSCLKPLIHISLKGAQTALEMWLKGKKLPKPHFWSQMGLIPLNHLEAFEKLTVSLSGLIKITSAKGFSFKHLYRLGKGLPLLRGRKERIKGLILPLSTSQLSHWLNCSANQIPWRGQRVRVGVSLRGVSLAEPHQVPLTWVEEFPFTTIGFGGSHKAVAKYPLELTSQRACLQGACRVHARRDTWRRE